MLDAPTITRRFVRKTDYYGDQRYRATIVLTNGAHVRGKGRYVDVAQEQATANLKSYMQMHYPGWQEVTPPAWEGSR